MKKVYFYDIECFLNFWCCTFKSLNGEIKQFVLFEDKNEIPQLKEFLKTISGLIGYNNLSYDNPLLEFVVKNDNICDVYNKSQEIIEAEFPAIKVPTINQLDLMSIWHFNGMAKTTSLKYVECAIRFSNVEDLPFHYTHIVRPEDIQIILDYNLNDVNATEAFYYITLGKCEGRYKGDDKIQLRKDIQKEFGIQCINYNDVKIGEEINKKYYLQTTNQNWWDVKQLESKREIINISDLIPDYIKFETEELKLFLEDIRACSFKPDEKFQRKFEFAGLKIEFKKGGLHAINKDKLVVPEEDETLQERDVSSMYAATIINNRIYPEHLDPKFLDVYKRIYDERLLIKKTNKSKSAAYKLSLNGVYGKLGAMKSWLKDELALFKVTFCGQLSLLMLIEQYYLNDVKLINANTDGITILFKKDQQTVVNSIDQKWQNTTKYFLENTNYKKLVQRDINNYTCIKENEIKQKGVFVQNVEIHQNCSQRIVAIALQEYFVNNIPVEKTIKECTDIYDFCCFAKKRGESRFEARYSDKTESLGKVVRYYVSTTGCTIMKVMPPLPKKILEGKLDEREITIQKNVLCTIFNKYIEKPIEDYLIDCSYYISECNKVIDNIEGKIKLKTKTKKNESKNNTL